MTPVCSPTYIYLKKQTGQKARALMSSFMRPAGEQPVQWALSTSEVLSTEGAGEFCQKPFLV